MSRRGSKGIKHGYFCIHPAHGDRHDGHSSCAGGNFDSFYSLRKKPMKCKIEKNTVQETLILPLYSRKL
ncbi:hypothetical protein, partial [uncultured Adlercreutzia sp.]|uniref:hypothetical protein n=1 Tax=uncultured Adlercreutzia sp. TaxID=875803 RepID=UPI00265CB087